MPDSYAMKIETVVTTKGTTRIPDAFRKELSLRSGSVITWSVQGGRLVGIKQAQGLNTMQQHIRKYSGSWKGISKVLKKTRPLV